MNKLIDIDKGLKQLYLDLVTNELNSDKKKSSVSAIPIVCNNCGWGGTLRKVIINGEKKYLCSRCYKKLEQTENEKSS